MLLSPVFRLLLLALLPVSVFAIDLNITATQHGKSIDPSQIKLIPKKNLTSSSLGHLTNGTNNGTAPFGGRRGGRAANPVGYSGNWCGASQHTPTTDRLTSVEGIFSTPDLSLRPNEGVPQFVAAWVGMDGANCQTALVQAGTTTEIQADGSQSSLAWFEWIPDAAYNIPNMPVSPGDMMYVKITATSSTQAVVHIENLNQDYTVEVQLSNGSPLCRLDAEWIVENFMTNFGQTPFARFGDIWFQQCEAKTTAGATIDVDGATMIYLQNNGPNPNCFAQEWDSSTFYAYSS